MVLVVWVGRCEVVSGGGIVMCWMKRIMVRFLRVSNRMDISLILSYLNVPKCVG